MSNNIKSIKLINVISACCNSGQQKLGVALGPPLIYNSINQLYLDRSTKYYFSLNRYILSEKLLSIFIYR